jgi:hypothetical protein
MTAHEGENQEQGQQECMRAGDGHMSEAELDYNLMGTFPASDPPSWTLGIERRKDLPRAYDGEKPSADQPSHHNERTPSA